MTDQIHRRKLLQLGMTGATVSQIGVLPCHSRSAFAAQPTGLPGRARSVIVIFCWGGMSHLDTFDMKPLASGNIRGEFQPVSTTVPGLSITEHLPRMSQQMQHLTVVRSVYHASADHRKAAYWNLTGHRPTGAEGGVAPPELPSRRDWPALGSQVAIALRHDRRYRRQKQVHRIRPEDVAPDAASLDWTGLRVTQKVELSTNVLGPGHFPTGSFGHQDGYTNHHTVELIGMIGRAAASSVPLTRRGNGPRGDFSTMVSGDSTAGDWGSDTHGRSGPLWLTGDGESREAHVGFGCHANKFITFNLVEIRKRHFAGSRQPFVLTCRVGINGDPGVRPSAAGQAGVWLDGNAAAVSRVLARDDRAQKLEVIIRPGVRYLTLAMLNGDGSTFFDDIAMRDVTLHAVAGELPEEPEPEQPVTVRPRGVTRDLAANLPRSISIPYPLADRGLLNGQYGGFLGLTYDPVFVHPGRGTAFSGVSPNSGTVDLKPGVPRRRLAERGLLLESLNSGFHWPAAGDGPGIRHSASQEQAVNMLLSPDVQLAFDLSQESEKIHALYGGHIAGQSVLLGRRLTDAGVPLVTVNIGAGDLNGSSGDHWDTHGNNFNRLKNDLLPRWDKAASALIQDLVQTGRIEDTLVVFLTEFGRTPVINGNAGRDHFPGCYTVLFAGAGTRGGHVLGQSDRTGTRPVAAACTPADIHATIFQSLGIVPDFQVHDTEGRPYVMCDGTPLPIFPHDNA